MASPARPLRLSFWDLPRELRDMIYEDYVTIDGGYVFDPGSGKLRSATPHAHPFALQRTCKRAAFEMAGLALSVNTVTFSTVGTMREAAFRFDFMMQGLHRYTKDTLYRQCEVEDLMYDTIPNSVRDSILGTFPRFWPALDALKYVWDVNPVHWRAEALIMCIDVEHSQTRKFLRFLVSQLAHTMPRDNTTYPDISCCPEDWHIPCEEDLDCLANILRPIFAKYEAAYGTPVIELDRIWDENRFAYRFSAAAVAIHFLQRHPASRIHMRRLILNEDREAVAFPESHGKGLIPFCSENPLLRIERRLDLGRNVLPAVLTIRRFRSLAWKYRMEAYGGGEPFQLRRAAEIYQGFYGSDPKQEEVLGVNELSDHLAGWIQEASVLPSSIILVLDGSFAPEHSSQMFRQLVVREAVWQEALETSYRRGLLLNSEDYSPPDWWGLDDPPYVYRGRLPGTEEFTAEWWHWRVGDAQYEGYICPGFPQMIRDITSGSGPVRCNFQVDAFLQDDVEKLVSDNSGWSKQEWDENKAADTREERHTLWTAPIPPFLRAFLKEDVLPDALAGAVTS